MKGKILLLIILIFAGAEMTKAQEITPAAGKNKSRPGAFYTPNALGSCTEPFPFPADTPEPYCQPGYTPNDTFPYIVPCRDITDRNTCHTPDGVAIGDGFAHLNVDSRNYKSGNYVIQTSNQKSLLYEVRGNNIMFIQDTTWSNTVNCHNGKPAFQRINGRSGMVWAPKSLSCAPNNSYSSSGTNAAFEYSEDQEEALRLLPANVTQCSANYIGDVSGTKQLIFNGDAKCGSFRGDILVLRNVSGAGTGEVFIYCKGVGLCGWYQNIDFSKPENNPKNWVGKNICAETAFGHDYGACYVGCHQEGINKPVRLSVSDSLKQVLVKGFFGIDLFDIEPAEGEHKIPIKPQDHLQNTTRSMLVNQYKIQQKNDPTPQVGPNEKILRLNQNNVSVTMSSNIHTDGSQIESNTDGDRAQPGGNQQVVTSEETLWNTKDVKEARLQDDLQGALSAISSTKTLSTNKPEGIDLTKKDNRLADRIIVPCNASKMTTTDTVKSSPENKNVFQVPQGRITLTVISGLADIIGAIAEGLGVTVNNTLCTCTKISNEEDLYNNVRTATYSFFPDQVVQKLDRVTKNGEEDNPYTNPVKGSGGGTVSINQSYAYTNFVNNANDAQKCSTLPFNTKHWNKHCANNEITNPGGTNLSPKPTPPLNLTYIDLTATQCKPNQSIQAVADLISRYFKGPSGNWGNNGSANYRALAETLMNQAITAGFNPAVYAALWIEETAASGVDNEPSWGLGCRGDLVGWGPEITLQVGQATDRNAVAAHVNAQARCIINTMRNAREGTSTPQEFYENFIVRRWAVGANGQTLTNAIRRFQEWYNRIAGTCGVVQ